jgi:iron complex transport system substrate-binding protein
MRRACFSVLFCVFSTAALPGADYPQRIVSLSPDLTEMLYGVGAMSRVVAVSNFDSYPPEAAKLPHLGDLDNLSLERLAGVRPDLVVMNAVQAPFLESSLRDLRLKILKTSNQTISQAYAAMLAIGRATGNDEQAAKLVATTREGLDRVARKTAGLAKPRVALIVDRTPGTLRDLYTATPGSYLAELVEIAGGRIAVSADARGYRKLGKEDLLAIDPDIILDANHAPRSRLSGNPLDAWSEMPELKAVRQRRVYVVSEEFVPHASQRMVQTAELFAKLIHPEAK